MAWNLAHAGRVRAMLQAAVADNWAHFDGRVANLAPNDPIDAAVLAFIGAGSTFVLRPPLDNLRATLTALRRLVTSLANRPLRVPAIPRPIGRMLREFAVALASGASDSSQRLLTEIEQFGGISHENLAYLQIRRLARLGKDKELLLHGSLPTLVYAEPPYAVREDIIGAWMRVNLEGPLGVHSAEVAFERVRDSSTDLAMLVDHRLLASDSADVVTFCALVALVRDDLGLRADLRANPAVDPAISAFLHDLDEPTASGEPDDESTDADATPEDRAQSFQGPHNRPRHGLIG